MRSYFEETRTSRNTNEERGIDNSVRDATCFFVHRNSNSVGSLTKRIFKRSFGFRECSPGLHNFTKRGRVTKYDSTTSSTTRERVE